MPRLYKGTETILKLYVPSCDESNIVNLKIGLFTDDPNNATEFYSDNMAIDGDTVFLRVNPWSFDLMNDGVINYVATIETDNDTIVQERQSNYFLKTPNVYTPTGGGNVDLSDYYTKPEVDEEIVNTKKWVQEQKYATEEWVQEQDGNIIGYVDTTLNFYSTKEEANATANSIRGDINDIKSNKIGFISGDETFAANYGEYKICDLKTVNGESIIGSGDISVAGGSGGVFEVEGENPTIEQFNEAITLFQQGKRVVFKQGEMVCTVIGASEKYIQVLYGDTYTTFIDTMSASGDNVYGFKAKHKSNYNGKPFDETYPIYDFPNLTMYGPPSNVKGLTHAIQYKNWYISATVNPDTLDVSCVLGDKLYVWNYANGEKDAKGYTIPRITDLSTQGGSSSGADECIIIYEPNAETYTDEEKAHNAEMIKKIHNGTVKTAYLRYRNHDYEDAYIYVPLAFGWEVGGNYGYMTGVCKYWYYGTLHYDYFAIDMDENGEVYKFEVEPMETGSGGGESIHYIDVIKSDYSLDFWSYWGLLQATTVVVKFYGENGFETKSILNLVWVGEDGDSYMWAWLNTNTIIKWYQDNSYTIETIGGGSGGADLSNYYTKAETDELIANIDTPSGGGSNSIVYHMATDWDITEAYNYFNEGKTIILINTDGRVGMVTDVSLADGMIRLNGFLGDLNGDAKPNRFECNNSYSLYEWKMAFHEDIEEIYSRLDNGEGGGSTPSTETDSGVYVLDYVGEYQIMYEEDNWDSVTNHVYADSERQEHNAEIYQAWKEGKIKALYYKHVENTFVEYGKTLQYQLVPCSVRWEDETENNGMAVTALYKRNNYFDTTDIHSAMFSLNEDGSLRGDYAESYQVVYEEINICEAYHDGEGYRLDNYAPINYIGGGWRSCEVDLVSETTRERVKLNYIASNDYWTENKSTATLYGTLSNGSIIKWDFSAQNGTIINEYAHAQIIPMEVDLSSYYTKEEVDGLIANINLGDGATIESIVANEVANQLTDNFKTINGESILGEGDITIEGGSNYEVYTIQGRNMTTDEWNEINNNLRNGIPCYISYSNQYNIYGWASYNEFSASISVTTAKEQAIWFQYGGIEFYSLENTGGGSGNIGELFYPTIHGPSIVGEMTFNDEQLPHVDISESVFCNFKARRTQSKDLWVNNIHIGTDTDTVKVVSPYYEATENMPDGAQEVYAEFTTTGIKEMGQYLSDKYVSKSKGNTLGNYISEDSAIVALSAGYLNRRVVEKALEEYKALFVDVSQGNFPSTSKRIPVTIERHINSNTETTGYTVWGWYSKTQTITWTFNMTNTDVYYTIE